MAKATDNPLIEVSDGLYLSKSIVDDICEVAETYSAQEHARLDLLGKAQSIGRGISDQFEHAAERYMAFDPAEVKRLVAIEAANQDVTDPRAIEIAEGYTNRNIAQMRGQSKPVHPSKYFMSDKEIAALPARMRRRLSVSQPAPAG